MVRPRAWIVTVLVLFAVALVARAQSSSASGPTTAPTTYKVKRGTLNLSVTANGAFEPVDPMEIRARPKAYQGDLFVVSAVAPGASVQKDQVILELEQSSLKRQIATAENDLTTSRANYDKAKADVTLGDTADALAMRMQEEDLKNAEAALKWWEDVDGKQMIQSADLALQNAKDNVGDQEDELDQLKKMYKSEELTSATADIVVKRAVRQLARAKTSAEMTAARTQKTKENDYEFQHVKVQRGVEQQKQALDKLKAQQAQAAILRQTALTSAKLWLDAVEEKLADLRADAEQFVVKAPQPLTVVSGQYVNGSWQGASPRGLRPGDKVNAHQVLMTAYVPAKLRFVAEIPENKALLVTNGMRATVTPNALPQLTFDGTSSEPAPVANGSGNFPATIELAGAVDSRIEPGMKASVTIEGAKLENVLTVPLAAVKNRQVTVRSRSGAESVVNVSTGRTDGESVEATAGLSEGDEVVVPPAPAKK